MTEHKFAELKEGERLTEFSMKPCGLPHFYMSAKVFPVYFGTARVQIVLGSQALKVQVVHSLSDKDFERQRDGFQLYLSWRAKAERIQTLYNELLFQVEAKHPEETRHETAKRYICEYRDRPSVTVKDNE